MASITVVYDASVLYPAPLRDFLMWLALADLYKARCTNQIHDEWITSLLRNRPDLSLAKLERTKNLMNTNIPNCLVQVKTVASFSLISPKLISDQRLTASKVKTEYSEAVHL